MSFGRVRPCEIPCIRLSLQTILFIIVHIIQSICIHKSLWQIRDVPVSYGRVVTPQFVREVRYEVFHFEISTTGPAGKVNSHSPHQQSYPVVLPHCCTHSCHILPNMILYKLKTSSPDPQPIRTMVSDYYRSNRVPVPDSSFEYNNVLLSKV